jgi:hypothetical protein
MLRSSFPFSFAQALIALAAMLLATSAFARHGDPPYSLIHAAKTAAEVPTVDVGTIDAAAERANAEAKRQAAAPTKRLATARGFAVSLASDRDGIWQTLADGSRLWRVRVRVAGATDLRVAFARLMLPHGATLHVIGANDDYQGPYAEADSDATEFRSPPVPGDAATIELHVPPGADASIELIRVEAGFRNLFKAALYTGPGESGACNVNVVCPLGDSYRDEIRAAAYYEFVADDDHDTYLCTGTLLADVPRDHRNYFLTAAHCVASASEAQSMVVYWNYQSTACNRLSPPSGGYFDDDQHAAALRATRADADFTLVELSSSERRREEDHLGPRARHDRQLHRNRRIEHQHALGDRPVSAGHHRRRLVGIGALRRGGLGRGPRQTRDRRALRRLRRVQHGESLAAERRNRLLRQTRERMERIERFFPPARLARSRE